MLEEGGWTDLGDVSWIAPALHVSVATTTGRRRCRRTQPGMV
jgi:hypothetical protein